MVCSPDWNFSFSEKTETTYQKAMDVVNIGSRLNNQPDISPVHFLSYCNFANYKYYKQKCICTREKQEVLAVT